MAVELVQELKFIVGEQKVVLFRVVDEYGVVVDLSGAVISLRVVAKVDGLERFTKVDGDFDKTDAALGIVKAVFTSNDLSISGNFEGQLKIVFTDGTIDKSLVFDILIEPAIVL